MTGVGSFRIQMMIRSSLGLGGIALVVATSAVVFACSSSTDGTSSSSGGTGTQSTAASVAGEADKHCGATVVKVDPAACTAHDEDAGDHDHDGGDQDQDAAGEADTGGDDFGETMYGSTGNDDDCKYRLSWTASPVSENNGVTFVLTAANLSDNTPVTGAEPYIEAFLDDHTPAPNSNSKSTEAAGGVYTIGPILFSQPGQWTVRFHLAGNCADAVDSPHGHGAFFVAVP